MIYLLKGTPTNRKLIHRYIDVFEYPDGRVQLRADGASLAYERYDRLPQVDTGAIVENKRLSHVLQAALVIQAQRDDRHASNTPSRTNSGHPPYAKKAVPGSKRSRQFTAEDLEAAIRVIGRPALPLQNRKLKGAPELDAVRPASGERVVQVRRQGSHRVRRVADCRNTPRPTQEGEVPFILGWRCDI